MLADINFLVSKIVRCKPVVCDFNRRTAKPIDLKQPVHCFLPWQTSEPTDVLTPTLYKRALCADYSRVCEFTRMPLPFAVSHMLYTHTSMKPGVEGGTPKLRGHKARKIFSESPRSAAVVFLLAFLSVHACVLCLPSPPSPPPLSLSFDTSRMKTFQIDRVHLCGAQSSCQSCHYTTLLSNSLFFLI